MYFAVPQGNFQQLSPHGFQYSGYNVQPISQQQSGFFQNPLYVGPSFQVMPPMVQSQTFVASPLLNTQLSNFQPFQSVSPQQNPKRVRKSKSPKRESPRTQSPLKHMKRVIKRKETLKFDSPNKVDPKQLQAAINRRKHQNQAQYSLNQAANINYRGQEELPYDDKIEEQKAKLQLMRHQYQNPLAAQENEQEIQANYYSEEEIEQPASMGAYHRNFYKQQLQRTEDQQKPITAYLKHAAQLQHQPQNVKPRLVNFMPAGFYDEQEESAEGAFSSPPQYMQPSYMPGPANPPRQSFKKSQNQTYQYPNLQMQQYQPPTMISAQVGDSTVMTEFRPVDTSVQVCGPKSKNSSKNISNISKGKGKLEQVDERDFEELDNEIFGIKHRKLGLNLQIPMSSESTKTFQPYQLQKHRSGGVPMNIVVHKSKLADEQPQQLQVCDSLQNEFQVNSGHNQVVNAPQLDPIGEKDIPRPSDRPAVSLVKESIIHQNENLINVQEGPAFAKVQQNIQLIERSESAIEEVLAPLIKMTSFGEAHAPKMINANPSFVGDFGKSLILVGTPSPNFPRKAPQKQESCALLERLCKAETSNGLSNISGAPSRFNNVYNASNPKNDSAVSQTIQKAPTRTWMNQVIGSSQDSGHNDSDFSDTGEKSRGAKFYAAIKMPTNVQPKYSEDEDFYLIGGEEPYSRIVDIDGLETIFQF